MRHQASTVDSKHVDIERARDEAPERYEEEWDNNLASQKNPTSVACGI
jgi:hypothetical protein